MPAAEYILDLGSSGTRISLDPKRQDNSQLAHIRCSSTEFGKSPFGSWVSGSH